MRPRGIAERGDRKQVKSFGKCGLGYMAVVNTGPYSTGIGDFSVKVMARLPLDGGQSGCKLVRFFCTRTQFSKVGFAYRDTGPACIDARFTKKKCKLLKR